MLCCVYKGLFFYKLNNKKRQPHWLVFFVFGGGEGPMTFNTISRELLNNAYNPRFSTTSKQAKQTMKTMVFSV